MNDHAVAARPTFSRRFWRALGWRYHLADLPAEADAMPGWAMTHVKLQFDLLDRLRLLTSGRLRLDIRQGLDAPVGQIISATSFEILPPGSGHSVTEE